MTITQLVQIPERRTMSEPREVIPKSEEKEKKNIQERPRDLWSGVEQTYIYYIPLGSDYPILAYHDQKKGGNLAKEYMWSCFPQPRVISYIDVDDL